ncbi:hypothetical protein DSUL_130005 [Desulfovibrionales bacterium]
MSTSLANDQHSGKKQPVNQLQECNTIPPSVRKKNCNMYSLLHLRPQVNESTCTRLLAVFFSPS